MAASTNRNNLLAVRLLQVRRHFNACRTCKGAMQSEDFDRLCTDVKRDLVFIAMRWEASIAGRIAIRKAGNDLQFLCPDLNAHGAAYAATAEPVSVTGLQETLF